MLYSTNSKNNASGDDLFNVNKNREKAERETERLQQAQKDQERNRIKVQIDNLDKVLNNSSMSVHLKEKFLSESRRKIDDAKRDLFAAKSQTKVKEGELMHAKNEALLQESKLADSEINLKKAKSKLELANREKEGLLLKNNTSKNSLQLVEQKIVRIKTDLTRLMSESETVKKEIAKKENDLNIKKLEAERLSQNFKNYDFDYKRSLIEKTKAVRLAQDKEKEAVKLKQELSFKKGNAEQHERNSNLLIKEIDTRKKEIERLTADLRLKERFLLDSKRMADESKKNILLLEEQIKRNDIGVSHINLDISSQGNQSTISENNSNKAKTDLSLLEKEKAELETVNFRNKKTLDDLEMRTNRLKEELRAASSEEGILKIETGKKDKEIFDQKNELDKLEQYYRTLETSSKQINVEKTKALKVAQEKALEEIKQSVDLKTRVVEQLEKESSKISQELNQLIQERVTKERELNELKRKLSNIR